MQHIRYHSFDIYPINKEILKDLRKHSPSPISCPLNIISELEPAVPCNSVQSSSKSWSVMMNGVEGGGEGGPMMAATSHAYQLSKMRVSQKHTGTTPTTPTQSSASVVPTPTTPAFNIFYGNSEECVLEDLQLAAELGKTLLERNRELETNIKHHQAVIDDQAQEIEYLSKQTAALREVNDSRLRIYEQLEISIQELEKNNQRLVAENSSDKKKIKNLCQQLESLESRNEELTRHLEEARSGAGPRGRNKTRRSIIMEEHNYRRSHSCENTIQNSEDRASEEMEYRTHIEELQERLRESQSGRLTEARMREELEIQLACLTQENNVMVEQLSVLKEKEFNLRSFDDELASLDDNSSGRLCRKCLGQVDETASNPMLDLHDSIEDTDVSIESIHGECALVKLKNGGYAWGSQESLASIGQVINNRNGSGGTSPGTDASDAPHNSLLSELDTSYRILIEKYEALLEAREIQQQQHMQEKMMIDTSCNHEGLINPGYDDFSGPMSLVMTDSQMPQSDVGKCNHCNTCSCDLKGNRPKSSLEEYSEVETNSSGFSDGESRLSNKETQTEDFNMKETLEDITPTPTKCLDLSSPINPCDKRFQTAPEYKKLFAEIFTVLKQTVDTDAKSTTGKSDQTQQYCDRSDTKTPTSTVTENSEIEVDSSTIVSHEDFRTPVVEQKTTTSINENEKDEDTKEMESVSQVLVNASEREQATACVAATDSDSTAVPSECSEGIDTDNASVDQKVDDESRVYHKPPRPDSLDLLSGSGSRPSSRQKRRHRRHRLRVEHQQLPYSGQYQYTHTNESIINQQQQQQYHGGHQGRHQRRDIYNYFNFNQRQHNQPNYHQNRPGEEYPSLGKDKEDGGNNTSTRVYYNSNQGRCEHHRSKRHRERSNNHKQQRSAENNENNEQQTQSHHNQEPRSQDTRNKISYPSVEVAKLRKLEMSYAEVLKTTLGRSNYNRRY